jgi:glycosyltransferase involved in cell wall biosynthesis
MQRLGVMHIIDTLSAAGAERVAVNMVNHLPRNRYIPYLCTTRCDGPLDAMVRGDVIRLRLRRKSRLDLAAIVRLRRFIQANKIRVLHAHGPSLFIARLAAIGTNASIFWHAHHGRYALEDQRAHHYRLATAGIAGVITVNRELSEWCARKLRVPVESIWYVPNPVALEAGQPGAVTLPGLKGSRIICVANFRAEKDHLTLVRAMAHVAREVPSAHLLLVGKCHDAAYLKLIEAEISALGLRNQITILGPRNDVSALLNHCDIGVLSSASEGLPISLLEYGATGLAVVATAVGQCSDVLDGGRAGVLVPSGAAGVLAEEMVALLRSPERRRELGSRLHSRVNQTYSAGNVMLQICAIYDAALGQSSDPRHLKSEMYVGSIANPVGKPESVPK